MPRPTGCGDLCAICLLFRQRTKLRVGLKLDDTATNAASLSSTGMATPQEQQQAVAVAVAGLKAKQAAVELPWPSKLPLGAVAAVGTATYGTHDAPVHFMQPR